MNLQIDRIVEHGKKEERVEISVLEDCNLRYFMIADTTYKGEHTISNKVRHTHWFSKKEVKKGDKIFLFTAKGTNSSERIGLSNTKYNIYWGLDICVWNDEGDGAILFHINSWKTTKSK
ncbi:MAG TPA: hypothetical protein VGN63_19075 [Flavisolibacter sp.]|jgi:hypothetical protein|nr:hypothetical protein [Flavisolibacter sp.]